MRDAPPSCSPRGHKHSALACLQVKLPWTLSHAPSYPESSITRGPRCQDSGLSGYKCGGSEERWLPGRFHRGERGWPPASRVGLVEARPGVLVFVPGCLGPRAFLKGHLPGCGPRGGFSSWSHRGKVTPTGGSVDMAVQGTVGGGGGGCHRWPREGACGEGAAGGEVPQAESLVQEEAGSQAPGGRGLLWLEGPGGRGPGLL